MHVCCKNFQQKDGSCLSYIATWTAYDWLLEIDWCLMPTLAIFQLYRGVNKFHATVTVVKWYLSITITFLWYVQKQKKQSVHYNNLTDHNDIEIS